jgi:transposase
VTKVALFELIRKEYFSQAKSIRGIARERSIHRRQVRQAIASALPPKRVVSKRTCTVLTPAVKAIIDQWLQEDQAAPRKQRHTGKRIYSRLCEEQDFQGALVTVQKHVGQQRKEQGLNSKVFIPQVHAAGDEAEVDWYEAMVDFPDGRKKVYIFQMRACHSGHEFHKAFFRQNQQSFLEAHVAALEYFGGVFNSIRYDNLTSAVKKVLKGRQRIETERFIALRSHYLFESVFCLPGIQGAHEKGGVEGGVGRFRRAYFVPVPTVLDIAALNQKLMCDCEKASQRTIQGKSISVKARWQNELAVLRALPNESFDASEVLSPRVNNKSLVAVKANFYSVPVRYVGQSVEARIHAQTVELYKQGKKIAEHLRCYGRYQIISEIAHYLPLLRYKPGALAGSQALAQARKRQSWPEHHDCYWKALLEKHPSQEANRLFIEFLFWAQDFTSQAVCAVLSCALEKGCYALDAIKVLMRQQQDASNPPAKLPQESLGSLVRYERPDACVHHYDQLLSPSGDTK